MNILFGKTITLFFFISKVYFMNYEERFQIKQDINLQQTIKLTVQPLIFWGFWVIFIIQQIYLLT